MYILLFNKLNILRIVWARYFTIEERNYNGARTTE